MRKIFSSTFDSVVSVSVSEDESLSSDDCGGDKFALWSRSGI